MEHSSSSVPEVTVRPREPGDVPPPLLRVDDLQVRLPVGKRTARILNGVSLSVRANEILGLVGETGSGKSMTAWAILNLVPPPGKIVGGSVAFDGSELLALDDDDLRLVRGGQISLIPQNARGALHPLLTVGQQLVNIFKVHIPESKDRLKVLAIDMLRDVGLPDPTDTFGRYPHELSGGMAQRIAIAIALGTSPKLVLADEPTTGLDATIQAQVLDLLAKKLAESRTSALLITHDLGLVANYADRVAVMHAGRVVEVSTVDEFFTNPRHPYSIALLRARLTRGSEAGGGILAGAPDPAALPSGCFYRGRCPNATAVCAEAAPPIRILPSGHLVECHHADAPAPKMAGSV